MTSKELEDYIDSLSKKGSVLGLNRMQELLQKMNNPEKQLRFVHIAGTNGKGSVLAFTSTILKEAGYKVGRYISPVIKEYREKIQINGRPITNKALLEGMEYIKSITDSMEEAPTIFEVETVLAFWYFAKNDCDIVVLETGLGGQDDATNVIENALVCAFASISMDHMAILGNTLEEIARVKAGIIKKGAYVVSARQEDSVFNVLNDRAKSLGNQDVRLADIPEKIKSKLSGTTFDLGKYKKLKISLLGLWQPENAAVAVKIIEALKDAGLSVSDKAIYDGLYKTEWFGRFTILNKKPLFICDGAHNEDASLRLCESIRYYLKDRKLIYIMGVLADKEYEKVIKNTVSLADSVITLTPPNNARALPAYDLAMAVKEYNPNVTAAGSVEEAVEMAQLLADKDCAIIAFGSLSYLGNLSRFKED